VRRGLAVVGAGLALALAGAVPAGAGDVPARPGGCGGHAGLQRELDTLTGQYGMAGAAAQVDDPACGRWTGTSGLADVRTGRPMRGDERIRIGSTTKSFTATVVLQLAAERRVSLDASVEQPGEDRTWKDAAYGLGLISTPLRCGGLYWGHGGSVPGYDTAGGIASDGRRVQLVLNQSVDSEQAYLTMHDAVQTALCEDR
jgi:hypothetical protein